MVTKSNLYRHVDGTDYKTNRPMTWVDPKSGASLNAPANSKFNVSVPRLLWLIFDPHKVEYFEASLFHDIALEQGWGRVAAAAPFAQLLQKQPLGRIHRLAMVLAVIAYRWR